MLEFNGGSHWRVPASAGGLMRSRIMASSTMAKPDSKAHADLDGIERPHHWHAEPAGADQGRDHHHR